MIKKPTIRDVAKLADVSPTTVSYVLNGVEKVSTETKARVLSVIEELNYYPDFTAISLSKRKSNLIGIMLPVEGSTASMIKENQYYNEFICGVELTARKSGFDILITGAGHPEECRSWVKKRNLDGLILLGRMAQELSFELKKLNIPIVLVDSSEQFTKDFYNIRINDEQGGYLATKHLIELGHQDIALIVNKLNSGPVSQKRFLGYQRALQEAGIPLNERLVFESREISLNHGYDIGKKMIESDEKITAIFTLADILAIGIMKALSDHQLRVPDDYSIVGFDDLHISQFMTPGLTTVKQDIYCKGVTTAETLIEAIELPTSKLKSIELPVQLIIRGTTKPI